MLRMNYIARPVEDTRYWVGMYSSGPNNGWVFFSTSIGGNACLWKNFKSYQVKKHMWAGFCLRINRHVDMLITATTILNFAEPIFKEI